MCFLYFLSTHLSADSAQDLNTMKQIASKYDIEIRVKENEYYTPASLDSKGYKYIKNTVEKIFDYAIAAPFILPAGTDARRFTELTDATIRFAPTIINTFLEAYDFSNKTITLFATSGSSGFGNTVNELKVSAPNALIKEGLLLNNLTTQRVKELLAL